MVTEAHRIVAAHRAFTRGRLKLASWGVAATVGLMTLGRLLGSDAKSLWFGAALLLVASASLFIGRAPGRAVLPAFAIGLIPFSALLLVQALTGPGCHTGACVSYCMPTCVVSGLVAGSLLAVVAVRTKGSFAFVGAGAAMICLVGALGCPCIGLASVAAMALGIAIPSLPLIPKLRH
jgi:hypothetical protein